MFSFIHFFNVLFTSVSNVTQCPSIMQMSFERQNMYLIYLQLISEVFKLTSFTVYKIRERKVRTLTRNWRDHSGKAHEHTHGNRIKIFWRTQPSFSIRRERMYLSTRQGHHRVRRNILILFPCVCSCASPPWSLQFLVRVLTFLSLILCYSYFGTFFSTWSFTVYFSMWI
jgi:hypothetical protein